MINGEYTVKIYVENGKQCAKVYTQFFNSLKREVYEPFDVGELLSDCIIKDTNEAKDLLDVEGNKVRMERAEQAYFHAKEYYERSQAYAEKVVKNEQSKQEALHESNNM